MSAYPFSCRSYGRERKDILDIASKLTLIHPYIMQRRSVCVDFMKNVCRIVVYPKIAFKIFSLKRVDKGWQRIYIGKCARKEATLQSAPNLDNIIV